MTTRPLTSSRYTARVLPSTRTNTMICFGALKNVIWVWSGAATPVVTLLVAKPSREAFGHARGPSIRTSLSEALHCLRARVSIFVPGLK